MTKNTKNLLPGEVAGLIKTLRYSEDSIADLQTALGLCAGFYDRIIGWVYPGVSAHAMRQNMRGGIISFEDLSEKIETFLK